MTYDATFPDADLDASAGQWYLLNTDGEIVTDDGVAVGFDEDEHGGVHSQDAQFELGYVLGRLDALRPEEAPHFARDAKSVRREVRE